MRETITNQHFERPSESVVRQIKFEIPSLNMYRFKSFGVGMCELSGLAESLTVIRLTFRVRLPYQADNIPTPMIEGNNRLLRWTWFKSLVPLHSEPWPKVLLLNPDHIESIADDERERYRKSLDNKDDEVKRNTSVRTVSLAMAALDRGTPLFDIRQSLMLSTTMLKRISRVWRQGGSASDCFQGEIGQSELNLLRFDERGEKTQLLSIDESKQVVSFLRAGCKTKDVALMFNISSYDLKMLSILPDADPATSSPDSVDDTETASKLENILSSE